MADLCKQSDVKLIASFFEDPADIPLWISQATSFEALGADMLELNFSSPSAARVFARSFDSASHIISEVKKNTSIPVGLKLSPTLEPLEAFVAACQDAGLDFISAHNAPAGIVIDVENEAPYELDEDKCWSCGFCVGICPTGAIELRDRRNKKRLSGITRDLQDPFYLRAIRHF